jgi:hypothetical protein
MDTPVTFTLASFIATFLAVCAGISAIAAALNWIIKGVKAINSPNLKQDKRLEILEQKSTKYEEYFASDKARIDSLEEGNRVTQRAILALLSHGIDGNEIEEMRIAKNELQDYLIKR